VLIATFYRVGSIECSLLLLSFSDILNNCQFFDSNFACNIDRNVTSIRIRLCNSIQWCAVGGLH